VRRPCATRLEFIERVAEPLIETGREAHHAWQATSPVRLACGAVTGDVPTLRYKTKCPFQTERLGIPGSEVFAPTLTDRQLLNKRLVLRPIPYSSLEAGRSDPPQTVACRA
jgi:hypothetical protein